MITLTAFSIWKRLDGKKTNIAVLYWSFVVPFLPVLYPAGVPSKISFTSNTIGLILTAVGLGHQAVKFYAAK